MICFYRLQEANNAYNNPFCFLKNKEDGKIAIVFHPADEQQDVVNCKKSIASAFQANLKKTDVEDETDAQSHHKSHYRYVYLLFQILLIQISGCYNFLTM